MILLCLKILLLSNLLLKKEIKQILQILITAQVRIKLSLQPKTTTQVRIKISRQAQTIPQVLKKISPQILTTTQLQVKLSPKLATTAQLQTTVLLIQSLVMINFTMGCLQDINIEDYRVHHSMMEVINRSS